jgi:hypothetical protein
VACSWCEHMLALILMIMTGGSLKMMSNWAVLTRGISIRADPRGYTGVCVLGMRTYGARRVDTRVWSHGMACMPVLDTWMTCAKRGSFWSIAPVCAGTLPTRTSGPLAGCM